MANSEWHKSVPICNEPRPHCHTGSRPSWQGKGSQHLSQSNGLSMKLQGFLGLSQNSAHVANRWDLLNESVNFQVQALQPMPSKLCIPNCGCSTQNKRISIIDYHNIFELKSEKNIHRISGTTLTKKSSEYNITCKYKHPKTSKTIPRTTQQRVSNRKATAIYLCVGRGLDHRFLFCDRDPCHPDHCFFTLSNSA